MKIGNNGINLIKFYEQCRLAAYICPAGVPTIGWGNTRYPNGFRYKGKVRMGQTVSQAEADAIFMKSLEEYENAVNRFFKVPLNQYQFDALVSFAYNLGSGIFNKSTFAREINKLNYLAADGGFEEYCKYRKGGRGPRVISKGLLKRRTIEKNLFFFGVEFSKDKITDEDAN